MPTEDMYDAIAIEEIQAQSLDLVPLPTPARSPRPLARLPRTAPPRTLGTRRHIGPINTQDQHRTAKAAGCHCRHALRDRLTRGRHVQHGEALGHLMRQRVHALTTDGDTTEMVQHRCSRVIR